jgi:hypothetical protein
MADKTFEKIALARTALPALCKEIHEFAVREIKPAVNFAPQPTNRDEKLLKAILEGFLERHTSLFGAMLVLEKSGYRSEWLMLSRALFEVSVDAQYFYNEIVREPTPGPTLQKIRYAHAVNEFQLLKDSEEIDEDKLEQLKETVVKVPGLNKDGHKNIARNRNFSGLNMADRSRQTDAGKYYKPVFARLSKYAHGMTYDQEILVSDGKSKEAHRRAQVTEESLNLYHCAMLVLDCLRVLCPLTFRPFDRTTLALLEGKIENLIDVD